MKKRSSSQAAAFTLVELLTVMVIILILAGLILGTVGFAQKKAARSRAQGEIQALETALESYKNDNAVYPRGNADGIPAVDTYSYDTDKLNANYNSSAIAYGDPSNAVYTNASLALYTLLSGDLSHDGTLTDGKTNYLGTGFKTDMFGRLNQSSPIAAGNKITYLSDPFGNSYGYSTANIAAQLKNSGTSTADPSTYPGYNSTFDLWSTSGNISTTPDSLKLKQPQWIKNWQ